MCPSDAAHGHPDQIGPRRADQAPRRVRLGDGGDAALKRGDGQCAGVSGEIFRNHEIARRHRPAPIGEVLQVASVSPPSVLRQGSIKISLDGVAGRADGALGSLYRYYVPFHELGSDRELLSEVRYLLREVRFPAYTREVNRLRAEATATHDGTRQRLTTLNRQIANIVDTVAAGRASPALLDRLEKLETEKNHLDQDLAGPAPEPVRFHPNVVDIYVSKVNGLREALNEVGAREEAAEILRGLIDEIRLHPIDGQLQIELIGDLATLLVFADEKGNKKPGSLGKPGRTKWLVAGARCHLYRTRRIFRRGSP